MARNRDERDDEDEEERPRARRRSRDDDDDDDRPLRRRRRMEEPKSSGGKTALIVCGILGGLFLICGGAAVAVYLTTIKPAVDKVQNALDNAKSNSTSSQGGKRIGLGMHNYADREAQLPAAYYFDKTTPRPWKTPANLGSQLSWRVSLLPYIEQDRLYSQFDLKSAWDSPQNKPLSQSAVSTYSDTDSPLDPTTRWRVFYDNGALFDSNPNMSTKFQNISDGTSNTIMVVEGGEKGPWSQFNDYKFDPNGTLPSLGRSNTMNPKFSVVMADGSVMTVRQSVDQRILKAAITKAGGEVEAINLRD